ncbi:major facilitator superfamily domain-containing protein [Diplogelasinospora grovesii]|uniref:Major facilitator superfamily domain-containing protein n=1 Tax=Diplogelasinospora grovesii TaxID=303347 RepID=A0AAN6N7G2_9PEZI|nr:major facilitator superfamily domain-containing protein [Diplogelasinospora grovesii]
MPVEVFVDTAHEQSSLLREATEGSPPEDLRALVRPKVVILSFVLICLAELGQGMWMPPLNALLESIICRKLHPGAAASGVLAEDSMCKNPDVQSYLAMLRGWATTFKCIPAILGAVPFGILSDRWGRRPVLALALLGMNLSFMFTYLVLLLSDVIPIWVVWLSSAFMLIGGGGATTGAMVYTFLADVVPVAERATIFFQLNSVFLVSEMIAGPLAGIMMEKSPWPPLAVALALLLLANLSVLLFPETLELHQPRGQEARQQERGGPCQNGNDDSRDLKAACVQRLARKAIDGLAEVWGFVLGNQSLAFLMTSLVFVILGRFVQELLLQYATKRYGWTWSRATFLLTIRSASSLVTLLVILPTLSWLCVNRLRMSGVAKDMWLARISGIVLVIACLLIAFAVNGYLLSAGLVWFALGSGLTSLIRSLLNALVEEHHVGTVNTLVGFMEMVGLMGAGPLLAESLSIGLNMGGLWIGLPFITAGLFFRISTLIMWTFRLPERRESVLEP